MFRSSPLWRTLVFSAQSLWRHRLRSTLSILGIVCGVISVMALIGIGEGAKRETLAQIEQLGTRNILVRVSAMTADQLKQARERGSSGLSETDARALADLPGVEDVGALREVRVATFGQVGEFMPTVYAVSANYLAMMQLAVERGRPFTPLDYADRKLVCLLGSQVAASLAVEGRAIDRLRVGKEICTMVGTLKRANAGQKKNQKVTLRDFDRAVLLPLGNEASLLAGGPLSELIVEIRDMDRVLDNLAPVSRVLEVTHRGARDYEIIAPQELIRQARQAQSTYDALLGGIAVLSMLVGGVGIMNIMLVSVTERTREIGLRRALGATRANIASQFLTESVLLTMLGGGIGVLLGAATVVGIAWLADWPAVMTAWAVLLSLLLSFTAGLVFGWYPAMKASRLDPITALRHD